MTNSVENRVPILLLSIGIMIASVLLIIYKAKKVFDTSAYQAEQSQEATLEIQRTLATIVELQLGHASYGHVGTHALAGRLDHATNPIRAAIQKLTTLGQKKTYLQPPLDSVERLATVILNIVDQYKTIGKEAEGWEVARGLRTGNGKPYLDSLKYGLAKIQNAEYRQLHLLTDTNKKSMIILYRIFLFIAGAQAVIIALSFFMIKRNVKVHRYAANTQSLYESIIVTSEDAIISKDKQGNITSWNRGAENLFHYSSKEVLGKPISILIPEHRLHEEIEIMNSVKQGKLVSSYDTERVTKEGGTVHVSLSVSPIRDAEGNIIGASKIARDITQRKLNEAALVKSLKDISDYKHALDESAIIAITDQRGIIKHVNENFCKISRFTVEELIGQDHRIINSGYHPKEFIRNLWTTIGHGKIWKGELKNKAKDGSTYWVDTTIVPFLNEVGKPYQYVAIRADITDRKRIEEESARSDIRFRSTLDKMLEGVGILGFDCNYLYVNDAYEKQVNHSKNELLGYTILQKFPEIESARIFKAIQQCIDERIAIHLEDEFTYKKDVTNTWFEISVQPVPEGVFILSVDITQKKQAEEKVRQSERIYKTVASNIPGSLICLLDQDYRYFLAEGDLLDRLGYSKEKLLGNKVADVVSSAVYTELLPQFKRVFAGESFKVENLRSAGVDTVTMFVPLKDETASVFAAMVVVLDVSELKKAQRAIAELAVDLEHKIKERTLELEMANKELESFSYSVAHDLRTPLRAINGYATMLTEDYGTQFDSEGQRLIDVIGRNAKRMGMLIDDLLTFSKLGRKQIQKSLVDMNEITASCLRDINLEEDYPGEIKIDKLHGVMADASLMKHVLINLLSNAIKYSSKKEKPVIEISSRAENGEIIYAIKDNGVGFDMEYAGKLFGVFQRLHADEEFEGTGVGLAIAERIIRRHNGKIWASSAVNQGATFCFSLPKIQALN